jgi:hypothetical protein
MSNRSKVFIASSREGFEVAAAVRDLVAAYPGDAVDVELWPDAFALSDTYIESLEKAVGRADFAVLVLSDDDTSVSREEERRTPRDNVIFELGLFIGSIGRNRCYLVKDERTDLKLPSDLLGVKRASYEHVHDGDLKRELARPCALIQGQIANLGPRKDKLPQSELVAWEAARTFTERIAGHWWSFRDWDDSRLGFVELAVDSSLSTPRVTGKAYGLDGKLAAHWESVSCCVHAKVGKLYYYFTGFHPGSLAQPVESYEGFTEYAFDAFTNRPETGIGIFSDRNLADATSMKRKSLRLQRCGEPEVRVMRSGKPEPIAAMVQKRLSRTA